MIHPTAVIVSYCALTIAAGAMPFSLLAPIDGSRMYFVRYSIGPSILHWNDADDGALTALRPQGAGTVKDQGAIYELIEDADHFEISGMKPKNGKHDVREAPCSLGG